MTWKLGSGEAVVDRHRSHIHPGVVALLPEAFAQIQSRGRQFLIEEVDFGRPIGETICVATRPCDVIVFAQRPKRFGLTRFVKNRQPEPCSSVVVILKTADNEADTYVLVTAFVGQRPEPEPWDQRNFAQKADPQDAERQAREFWNSHALIWGCEPVISGTETTRYPW